ncbi:MAG: hypothetical protein J5I90_02880 [Caldilineales bacterium]|nr:hypothetical protein [Caldilineales bacterium]
MNLTLTLDVLDPITARVNAANGAFHAHYPGDSIDRQPVHTLYGGAHLFKSSTPMKLGSLGLRSLDEYAPNFVLFAKILGMKGAETLPMTEKAIAYLCEALTSDPEAVRRANEPAYIAYTIYQRVRKKLETEPVEDMRVDFEDGYGNRPDEEEDFHAVTVGEQLATGMSEGVLSPFIGIRIKSFSHECYQRAVRTLDLALTALANESGGRMPDHFVVTLPKVTIPEQVAALADLLDVLEEKLGIEHGRVGIDLMIETTQAIINHLGENAVNNLVRAGRGRVKSCAYGTYDYTAICNITAHYQTHTHPAADFARHVMQVSLAQTGVTMSDGATTIMPIAPHRATPDKPLSAQQVAENLEIVHHGWKLHYDNITHSLRHAFYQGWDLNPAQLPIRYAAVYHFFLDSLADASMRLDAFINKAAQATLFGNTFDDAATGQGLLNFFLRGIACGAITEEEAMATGITMPELRSRSFVKIVQGRAGK